MATRRRTARYIRQLDWPHATNTPGDRFRQLPPMLWRARGPIWRKVRFGWGTWIRTKIDGVRVRSSTVELSPKKSPRQNKDILARFGNRGGKRRARSSGAFLARSPRLCQRLPLAVAHGFFEPRNGAPQRRHAAISGWILASALCRASKQTGSSAVPRPSAMMESAFEIGMAAR
jgi:hypothetical protein